MGRFLRGKQTMQAQRVLVKHALHRLFERLDGGSFTVVYNDGTRESYGDDEPQFEIRFKTDDLPDLLGDDLLTRFGEAYMDGLVDVEGDLADLIALALRNGLMSVVQTQTGLKSIALMAVGKLRSQARDKQNIAHHYDLGNDFFRLWLDPSLTYSCGYFRNTSDSLGEAQRQKIDHSLRKLRLLPGETLLDIGCGWGALIMRAAELYGARATGITLSEEQYAGAMAAITERGLKDKVNVRLIDYETLAAEGTQFDKVASIGMIEH